MVRIAMVYDVAGFNPIKVLIKPTLWLKSLPWTTSAGPGS
jgi:hypothetical protein